MGKNASYEYYAKLDGLSYSASPSDVINFLNDVEIVEREGGVRFLKNSAGQPTGECVIKLGIEEDLKKVLAYHGKYMGRRYVNVTRSNRNEYENSLNSPMKEFIVRLRGLPYSAKIEDVEDFFKDLEIVSNGIFIPKEEGGRPLGIAFVHFVNQDNYNKAFTYDKKNMGSRYIEVFASSSDELNRKLNRYESRPTTRGSSRYGSGSPPPPQYNTSRRYYDRAESYDRYSDPHRRSTNYNRDYEGYRGHYGVSPAGGGRHYDSAYSRYYSGVNSTIQQPIQNPNYHVVRVEGLPYEATKNEIRQFFSPENPTYINVILDKGGRSSGYADVYFTTHEECVNAMKKDNDYLGGRYLKLKMFSKKSPSPIQTAAPSQTTNTYYQPPSEIPQTILAKEMIYQPQPDPYSYPTTFAYPFYPMNYGSYYGDMAILSSTTPSASLPQSYIPPHMYTTKQPGENNNPYAPQIPIIPSAATDQLYNDRSSSATNNETQTNSNYNENNSAQFPKY